MSWAQWMVVNFSLEEQLTMEKQARAVLSHYDVDQIRKLCASLVKQNQMQQALIKQATGRIIELESIVTCAGLESNI
jgi:hypothetical protein